MHGRACKQYIFRSCKIYFQWCAFRWKSFLHASAKKARETVMGFKLGTLTGRFQVTSCQCQKGDRNSCGFQIGHFDRSFSSDIMAVKGLINNNNNNCLVHCTVFLSLISSLSACTQFSLGSIVRRWTELAVINHSFQYRYGYGQVNIPTIIITVRACQGTVCRVHRATYRFAQRAFTWL